MASILRVLWIMLPVRALVFGPPDVGVYNCARSAPYHPSIHQLGNTGIMGQVHAQGAWCVTRIIDRVAYRGRNMRQEVAHDVVQTLTRKLHDRPVRILEIGCGVGTFTHELDIECAKAFDDYNITAIDTSAEMLMYAMDHISEHVKLTQLNGVDAGVSTETTYDVAISVMMLHEMPRVAHEEMIHALFRATHDGIDGGEIWLVDIDPMYTPSGSMLSGEPYVPEYLQTIDETVNTMCTKRHKTVNTFSVVEGHVRAWVIRRA